MELCARSLRVLVRLAVAGLCMTVTAAVDGAALGVVGLVIAHAARLDGASRGCRLRVEVQHDRRPAEIRELDGAHVLVR